jgi:tetratricopeptide (TPR) repeat protein
MIVQDWNSKLRPVALCVLFLMIGTLMRTPPANAQGAAFDPLPDQPFDGRSGEILGTVYLNNSNQPAAQVLVSIRSLSSAMSRSVLTDFEGHFEFRSLPPGTYQISVEEQGYEHASTIAQVNFFPSEVTLNVKSSRASAPGGSSYSVSVRQLKIPTKAQDEFVRGLDRLAKGDPTGSLSHFNKAAAAYPDYYEAFYDIGVAEMRLHHQDKAMEAFQKSIDLSEGRYALPQFAYGLLLCQQRKPAEGERLIRSGLETDPDAPEGHLFLAIALLAQNRVDEAEKSVREALLRKPQYSDAYLVLSDLHGRRKDYQAQLQDLDTYLKLAPAAPGNEVARQTREAVRHLAATSSPQN